MAPQAPSLRVALAGFGLAGAVLHAPLIDATDGLEIAAIITRDPERRARAAREHPSARVADALYEVLGEVDVVVVVAPNRFHAEQATVALDAGCHVVVDKPLAVTAAEARALEARAAADARVLAVFHNRRWDDDFLTLRRVVEEGTLGRILRMESRFDRWRPQVKDGAWRELADPRDGGGLLLDLGSHLADQAVQLLGPVETVYAELDRRRAGAEVEDDVFIALGHASGARSHLWAGVHAAHRPPRFRVLGDRAAYVVEGLDPQEAQLRAGMRPDDPAFGRREREQWATLHDGERATPVPMERGRWIAFYEGFVAAVRDGAPPPVGAAEACAVLELLEAARAGAAQRSVVTMG